MASPRPRRLWQRYGVAVAAVGVAFLGRQALTSVIGPTRLAFTLFFPAIAFAAWYGRLGPGILALGLSALVSDWFFFEPIGTFSLDDPAPFATFLLSAGIIVAAIEAMHRSRRRVAHARDALSTTLASIGDGVVVTDALGRVSFLNPEAERMTGWRSADAEGHPLAEVFRIVNERTRREAESPVEKVLRDGKVVGLANHTVLVARDGTETPIDDSAAPVRTPGEPILGVVLVFRDVRAQRAAEAARARLAAIVESSGDAILSKGVDGTIETWNAAAERLFGYRAEEVIGQPVSVLIPSELRGEEESILDRLRAGRGSALIETTRLAKDGRRIPVSVRVSPLRDADGEVIGASKTVRDLSDLVAARDALAREKDLLATTLSSIGDAVIATDAGGRVTFLNPVAEDLTGWSPSEAEGRPLVDVFRIVNEATRSEVENPALRAMREGAIVGLANHTVLVCRSGSERAIDDSAAPIRDSGGRVVGSVLVFRDVTERRAAEKTLRESEARERAARAEAERANRAKDEFVATLSHELRTPLNAILGWSRLLEKDPGCVKTVREGVGVITRSAKSQADLVADLLDMSRIVSGRLRLDIRDVDLSAAVVAAVDAVRPGADAKGIRVEASTDLAETSVRGDAGRLQQVVWNLLTNSLKFTPPGGRIDVAVACVGPSAVIRVSDTGAGITPEFLPLVFGRFRQQDASTARRHGGLGLGLSIVKHIVELHGGTVRAESPGPGRGATFTVTLPRAPEREPSVPGADLPAAAAPSGGDEVDLAGVEVLAIDDHPDALALLARLLEARRARVVAAATADAALEALRRQRPHVVVCDIGLPEKDGFQFLAEMRAEGWDVPALAVTALAREEDRLRTLRAGFAAHIAKPFEPSELVSAVAALAQPPRRTPRASP